MAIINTTFKLRRGTAAQWIEKNTLLADGEPGFEIDTGKLKIGNGTTYWNNLPYLVGEGSSELTVLKETIIDPQTQEELGYKLTMIDGKEVILTEFEVYNGKSGVWVGEEAPPEGYNIWINPNGEVSEEKNDNENKLLEHLTWEIDKNNMITITGCDIRNINDSYVLPNIIEGYRVQSIGANAFRDIFFTDLIIPDTVLNIKDNAFTAATISGDLKLGQNIKTIGAEAFQHSGGSKILTIPESVIAIGDYAFENCGAITKVNFNAINCVEANTIFTMCNGINNITIGKDVTNIPDNIFKFCPINDIIIPRSVKSIGAGAFEYCSYLKDIYYEGTKEEWEAIGYVADPMVTVHYNHTPATIEYIDNKLGDIETILDEIIATQEDFIGGAE